MRLCAIDKINFLSCNRYALLLIRNINILITFAYRFRFEVFECNQTNKIARILCLPVTFMTQFAIHDLNTSKANTKIFWNLVWKCIHSSCNISMAIIQKLLKTFLLTLQPYYNPHYVTLGLRSAWDFFYLQLWRVAEEFVRRSYYNSLHGATISRDKKSRVYRMKKLNVRSGRRPIGKGITIEPFTIACQRVEAGWPLVPRKTSKTRRVCYNIAASVLWAARRVSPIVT